MKTIWVYIKEHNLQDPKNKRKICPDEKLGKILPARTDMLKMNQQLSKHVYTQGEKAVLLKSNSCCDSAAPQDGEFWFLMAYSHVLCPSRTRGLV